MPIPAPPRMVWIDIETTGLDVDRDAVLEVGCVITDGALEAVGHRSFVIKTNPHALEQMHPVAKEMHEANGLLDAIRKGEGIDMVTAESHLMQFIDRYTFSEHRPLCGSSVQFDRNFLDVYMPGLMSMFHYRNIDVSTFKELVAIWCPDKAAPTHRLKTHRPIEDLECSIDELRHYRENLFQL